MLRSLFLSLALALALALAGAHVPSAQAQEAGPTVQEMLPACEAYGVMPPPKAAWLNFLMGECVGTIIGISTLMTFNCDSLKDGRGTPLAAFAAGLPPDRGAAVQAWLDWVRADQARTRQAFNVSVIQALGETFPCKF